VKPILFHRQARFELDRAVGYYERQKQGLGLDLHAEVEKAVAKIQQNPKLGSPYQVEEIRYFLVSRFPYVIYYADLPEYIWVVAIAHGSRKPGYWRKRKVE
jgi:toxin ParE1/3/4